MQKLHESYRKLREVGCEKNVIKGLDDAICIFVRNIKEVESIVWSGRSPDQRKENKMKAAKLNMNLKEIIHNLLALVQQALLEEDRRNGDLISKVKAKLEKLFQVEKEYDQLISGIKPFFEIV